MSNKRVPQTPQRNLALELVRVTEAAALAAARWQGRGDAASADAAAAEAMQVVLNSITMDGLVVIGQDEKGKSPHLYNGERLGAGESPQTDIAANAVEGALLVAQGRGNSMSVIALAERGAMFDPGPTSYMEKIVVGPEAVGTVDLDRPPADNVRAVAKAKQEDARDVTVTILDRPRNADLVAQIRDSGARIRLIQEGDIAGALASVWKDSESDMLYGIGGTPEAVITAAALQCMGGEIQARLWPRNSEEQQQAVGAGYDLDMVMLTDDLVKKGDTFFAATGITHSPLLAGVSYLGDSATTHSIVMRSKSGTVRTIEARHSLDRLSAFSKIDYE